MSTKPIVIDGPIGQYSFSRQFMRNELSGQSKNPVLIKISSLGGSVDDALNIYDQYITWQYNSRAFCFCGQFGNPDFTGCENSEDE